MNDPVLLRGYVRQVLALDPNPRPGREMSERMLFTAVDRLCRVQLAADEFSAALQWNIAQGHLLKWWDDERGADMVKLTKEGKAKEGVK